MTWGLGMLKKDLIGKKIGNLLILSFDHIDERHYSYWVCLCDCGNKVIRTRHTLIGALQRKSLSSCGCLQRHGAESSIHRLFIKYKLNASKRSREFSLLEDDFALLIMRPCYYCGVLKFNLFVDGRSTQFYYNSLDRKDNSRGYTIDNVVPACSICNHMKQKYSVSEFINQAHKISKCHSNETI